MSVFVSALVFATVLGEYAHIKTCTTVGGWFPAAPAQWMYGAEKVFRLVCLQCCPSRNKHLGIGPFLMSASGLLHLRSDSLGPGEEGSLRTPGSCSVGKQPVEVCVFYRCAA